MWQVEDLIRASNFDMNRIDSSIIAAYGINDPAQHQAVYDWWDNLCAMMHNEKIEQKGHLQIVRSLLDDIYNFHLYLLTQNDEIAYQNAFQTAYPDLEAIQNKIPNGAHMHHLDLAMTALYDYFLLKLQKKVVLADTLNAVVRISHFMSLLSAKYLKAEKELHKELDTNADQTLIKKS